MRLALFSPSAFILNDHAISFRSHLIHTQPVMLGPEAFQRFHEWRHDSNHGNDTDDGGGSIRNDAEDARRLNGNLLMIGMSANATDEGIQSCFEHGMHFFCPKPPETQLLSAILITVREQMHAKSTMLIEDVVDAICAKAEIDRCTSHIAKDTEGDAADPTGDRIQQQSQSQSQQWAASKVPGWKIFCSRNRPEPSQLEGEAQAQYDDN
jgi:CheY-like chemotaxis protein